MITRILPILALFLLLSIPSTLFAQGKSYVAMPTLRFNGDRERAVKPILSTLPRAYATIEDQYKPLTLAAFTQAPVAQGPTIKQRVAAVFIKPGRQKLDWTKTKPRFNKAMHWIALAIGAGGTFADGFESKKIIKTIVQDRDTGAVTVICESNNLFKDAGGCGFKRNKFFLIQGGGFIGGSEVMRPFLAAPADMVEIFIGVIGFVNMARGKSIINRSIIVGRKP